MIRFGVLVGSLAVLWQVAPPARTARRAPPDLVGLWMTPTWDTTGIRCFGYLKNQYYDDLQTKHVVVLHADSTYAQLCKLRHPSDPTSEEEDWTTQGGGLWRVVGDTLVVGMPYAERGDTTTLFRFVFKLAGGKLTLTNVKGKIGDYSVPPGPYVRTDSIEPLEPDSTAPHEP